MSVKTSILAFATAAALAPVAHTCPVTGQKFFIKRMTIGEKENYYKKISESEEGMGNATSLTMIAVDEKGKPIFDGSDIPSLANLPSEIFESAFKKFSEAGKPETVEAAEKNSEPRT